MNSTKKVLESIFLKPSRVLLLLLSFLLFLSSCQEEKKASGTGMIEVKEAPSAISIAGLQQRNYTAVLSFEKPLQETERYKADLWSYSSDSLTIYALVNTPKIDVPEKGFPVLIFGHGFHPEPKRYGVSNLTGKDWRPGDYYRGIPETYAENGFLVITPDYRGHNISEGFEFTKTGYLASTYYAIDVLNLIAALESLQNADLQSIYFMGHSMGGDVGLKVVLANKKIKAASFWSGVFATTWQQALYYGQNHDKGHDKITNASMKSYMSKTDSVIQDLGFEYDINTGDAIHYVENLHVPLIIHHAKWERSVPYYWSENLVATLFEHNKPFEFYSYDSEHHLFKGENRNKAVQRDLEFFNTYK